MESLKTILLKQHIGAPCQAVVKKGDILKRGTLLAVPAGLGAPIYSPYDGTVAGITDNAVIIQPADTQSEGFEPILPEDDSKLAAIQAAGLVGMGGAGFPTAVKLRTDLKGGYILVNAAECEPLLGHNMRQLETMTEQTVRGVHYCMEITNAKKGVFAIKAKHKEAVAALEKALEKEPDISIHLLPDLYPMGEERAVVREVLGKLLSPTELPSAADAVVINAETVLRAAQAIEEKRPAITKNVTVAGKLKGSKGPHIFMDVPIGTTVGELIERAGGIDGEYGEIIMGGPFTGKPTTLDAPITKTTGGILVTKPFENLNHKKTGLLVCACGGNEARMRDLAEKMNGDVVLVQSCKQAADIKGTLKCQNPGNCPGQAQKCLNFKKAGCEEIIIGNCSDCTNTVMGSAPRLGLNVHHQTDHVFQTMDMEVMRYLTKSKKLPQEEAAPDTNSPAASASTAPAALEASGTAPAAPVNEDLPKPYSFASGSGDGVIRIHIEEGRDINLEFRLAGPSV